MSYSRGNTTLIVVVIALLILGLVTVFAVTGFGVGQNLFNKSGGEVVGPAVSTDAQVDKLNSQSTSDEIGAIERDINETDLDSLDSDLNDISDDFDSL